MDAVRLLKIEEIFHDTLDVPVEDRPDFLSKMCGDDAELFREVETLLAFAEESSSLMDIPPVDVAAEIFAQRDYADFIGRKIRQYKILSHLGTGGMGDVFLAEDTELERFAAIKFIKPEIAQMPDQLRRFLREAKTVSALNHPNIITVYEIGETDHIKFIATEFIDGKTLRKVMREDSLTLDETLGIISQVANAVYAAHTAGIIHRDIKPENIMLREDKLVKVLDFGLAKLQKGEINGKTEKWKTKGGADTEIFLTENSLQNLTATGLMMGTPAYMSPEQARIEIIDKRSDIWSIGVVLYEMCFGRKPFYGETTGEKINAILQQEPEPPDEHSNFELNRIIARALQKKPENRYQSVPEFLQDINNFQRVLKLEDRFTDDFSPDYTKQITLPNESRDTGDRRLTVNSVEISNAGNNFPLAKSVFDSIKKRKFFAAGIFALLIFGLIFGFYVYSSKNLPTDNSIAVVPFVNQSGDPNLEYLADGISESLSNALSQLTNVKVIAHNSSIKYKGKEAELEKASRDLGIRFILSGQISQSGDNLQVNAELVDILDKTTIWSRQFNRKSSEVSLVEAEISRQIADRLKLHLPKTGQEHLVKKTKSNPQAYELLLKGRFFQSKSSFESSKKAVEYYNQALAVDPNYAQVYAALASTYFYIGANGFQYPKEVMAKARAAAERAMELDDNLPEASIALAAIKLAERDWAGAEHEYQRAIELNPNLAAAHFKYAFYLSLRGHHEKAIAEIKLARELDPLKPLINIDIAYILYFARQYDPALEQFDIGLELNPNNGSTYYGKGFVNSARGQFLEAVANYRAMIRLEGEHPGVDCYLGFALAKSGQNSEAQAILKKLETGNKYVSPVELAVLYLGLDEREKALSTLERAFAENDSQLRFLGIEPHFDELRGTPRFIELMRRVGLSQ